MRCVSWHVDSLAGSCDRFGAAEGHYDLALEHMKHLLETVVVGRRTAALWNVHVDKGIATRSVVTREKDCIGVACNRAVAQAFVLVRSCKSETALGVISRNWQGSARAVVHGSTP